MKKSLFMASALMLFAVSCTQDQNPPPVAPELSLSADNEHVTLSQDALSAKITADADGAEAEITVNTNLNAWSLSEGPEWVEVDKNGDTLTFVIAPNNGVQVRNADFTITVKNSLGTITASVGVEQTGVPEAELQLSAETVGIASAGGSAEVSFTTNQSVVEVSIPAADNWLSFELGDDTVTFSADTNESGAARSTEVTVTAGTGDNTASATVTVSQDKFVKGLVFVAKTTSTAKTLSMPTLSTNDADKSFTVDFGDGQTQTYTSNLASSVQHTYDSEGEFTVTITSDNVISAFSFSGNARVAKVLNNGLDMSGVTSLSQAFNNCRALVSVAAGVFAPCTGVTTVGNMFYGCVALTEVGEGLFANMSKLKTASNVFQNCSALKAAPARLFAGCSAVTTFSSCFSGCTALAEVAGDIFKGCSAVTEIKYIFMNCSALKTVPAELFKDCIANTSVWSSFNSSGLTEVPEGLFDAFSNLSEMEYCFGSCYSLEKVPVSLLDNCRKVTSFDYAFTRCKLTGESPYTMIDGVKVHLYERKNYPDYFRAPLAFEGCFNGCTELSDFGAIMQQGWGEE